MALEQMMASTIPPLIQHAASAVQPLVFEWDNSVAPYSTAGTVFIVKHGDGLYVLTTRHGLDPVNCGPICVFPTDRSHKNLPLGRVFFVDREVVDFDYLDLAVIDIDTCRLDENDLSELSLIDLDRDAGDWLTTPDQAPLYLLGYPTERSEVMYATKEIRTDRIILKGKYVGEGPSPYLHTLHIEDSMGFTTYSGFSGGPVLRVQTTQAGKPTLVLCGMAIMGTPSSQLVHFIDRTVLLDAIRVKQHQDHQQRK